MAIGDRVRNAIGEDQWELIAELARWVVRSYVVVIVIGIVVGLQVAPAVSELAAEPATGTVAVVTLQGGIDGQNAASVVERLQQARQDPSVKAVVLRVNSGGGGASASEAIYMAVKRTAKEMPVVVSINAIAASGAYYSSIPADAIYTKPASFVGSIGVIFVAPPDINPIDRVIITGPNKLTGNDRRGWTYQIEEARRAFAGAVMAHRGDELEISEAELSYANLYSGARAVDIGLADRIGGLEDAIARAASMAGVERYRVEVLGYAGTVAFVTQTAYLATRVEDKKRISASYFVQRPSEVGVPNLLMLPPSVVEAGLRDEIEANATEVRPDGTNTTA